MSRQNSRKPAFVPADAFAKISLIDDNENKFKFPKDLPLHSTNSLCDFVIETSRNRPNTVFKAEFTVFIPEYKEEALPVIEGAGPVVAAPQAVTEKSPETEYQDTTDEIPF